MSNSICVMIDGGSGEERALVSGAIEKGLIDIGFTGVTNSVASEDKTDENMATLLDYATKANPDLFSQPIEIMEAPDDVDDSGDGTNDITDDIPELESLG